MYLFERVRARVCVCVRVCECVYLRLFVQICLNIFMYAYIHVCRYICMYMYTCVCEYGVATISRRLKSESLFCRISSLL